LDRKLEKHKGELAKSKVLPDQFTRVIESLKKEMIELDKGIVKQCKADIKSHVHHLFKEKPTKESFSNDMFKIAEGFEICQLLQPQEDSALVTKFINAIRYQADKQAFTNRDTLTVPSDMPKMNGFDLHRTLALLKKIPAPSAGLDAYHSNAPAANAAVRSDLNSSAELPEVNLDEGRRNSTNAKVQQALSTASLWSKPPPKPPSQEALKNAIETANQSPPPQPPSQEALQAALDKNKNAADNSAVSPRPKK